MSSSEELALTGGGAGHGAAAACFELFVLVGRFDPVGGVVEVM